MSKKRRGKETIVQCCSCGARVPRDKAVLYESPLVFKAEDPNKPDEVVVQTTTFRKRWYCVSCGKHRGIFQKKKRHQDMRRERRRE